MLQFQRYDFDADYIARLVAGDGATEEHFVRYFGPLLTVKLRRRLRSGAEDARQETLLRVMRTLKTRGGLATPGSLGAFVNSVANNVLFETYRTQSQHALLDEGVPELADGEASVESALMTNEARAEVRRVVSQLPPKDRTVLTWLFFEERDKDTICRELNVDRNYLRLLVHRAKARFKSAFMA